MDDQVTAIEQLNRPTLAAALCHEISRVRDQVMPDFIKLGPPGEIALALMRNDMDRAITALSQQDAIECLRSFKTLKGYRA